MQVFSENIIKLWNEWDVRVLILTSLVLQVILTIMGAQRKYMTGIWKMTVVWSAYISADWVATYVLGILARREDSSNCLLQAFWAPFLLLHLGGPDPITAFSLEDNALWLRHLLRLIVQVGLAFYVFLRCWSNTWITYITIPIFITGIIKYGERTYVLRSSSIQYFKDRLLSDPDPGPDFTVVHHNQQIVYKRRAQEGETKSFMKCCAPCFGYEDIEWSPTRPANVLPREQIYPGANYIEVAFYLYKRFRYLFADLILSNYEREDNYFEMKRKTAEKAFQLVAVELGFLYDELFTKATVAFSIFGIIVRFIAFCCSTSVLVSFAIINDFHSTSHSLQTDEVVTYILMIGAVVLDIYSFIAPIFTDWMTLYMSQTNRCAQCHCQSSQADQADRRRWSEQIGQYNLISYCFQIVKSSSIRRGKLPWIGTLLEKDQYSTQIDVTPFLKDIIFKQLHEKAIRLKNDGFSAESCRKLLNLRGDGVLKRYHIFDQFRWSITDVELDHSILLWHIATNLYFGTLDDASKFIVSLYYVTLDNASKSMASSKQLSEYMLYLLVLRQSMLPEGIAEIRYRDTVAECKRFFEKRTEPETPSNETLACKALLEVNFGHEEERIKGDRSQSVLFFGCRLAKQLIELQLDGDRKWEMISEVWVEMLMYTANKCRWYEHAQQLRKGGELLTHVKLLMANLGLSEQYRIHQRFFGNSTKLLQGELSEQQRKEKIERGIRIIFLTITRAICVDFIDSYCRCCWPCCRKCDPDRDSD